jgi:hypothetical protein
MSQVSQEYTLRVGEKADIKRSFFGASYSIIYAGMPGESAYSVVITIGSGYQALAYNLFLSARDRRIKLPKGFLSVIDIATDEIRFRVEGE